MRELTMIRRTMMTAMVAVGCALVAPASASAQGAADTTAPAMTAAPMTTTATDTVPVRQDDDRDYGWIGLLGLAGLLGLKRREPTVVHRDPAPRDAGVRDPNTTRDTMR